MIWRKTRHEVKQLRADVADLRNMLRTHFDIKYTMEDFKAWCDGHPAAKDIPASVGEFLHLYDMLSPEVKALYFRGLRVEPKKNDDLSNL